MAPVLFANFLIRKRLKLRSSDTNNQARWLLPAGITFMDCDVAVEGKVCESLL
jgi:hypothetical protein